MTLTCLLLFMGAMGKSAQFLLHTWLPDAMEGPTPVSALIHAATMVTAGVFMVARLSPLFELAPKAQAVVMFFGATTAFFAATVAWCRTTSSASSPIRPARNSATCSSRSGRGLLGRHVPSVHPRLLQGAAVPGRGSVIHAMHHEQDIRKMGGLWRKIPFTYATMCIGTLALTGFPSFAGYFSKDAIIESAYGLAEPSRSTAS